MNKSLFENCLKEDEIERLVLQSDPGGPNLGFSRHLNDCKRCRRRFFEMRMFHQILTSELNKPTSGKILNLVRGLERKRILE